MSRAVYVHVERELVRRAGVCGPSLPTSPRPPPRAHFGLQLGHTAPIWLSRSALYEVAFGLAHWSACPTHRRPRQPLVIRTICSRFTWSCSMDEWKETSRQVRLRWERPESSLMSTIESKCANYGIMAMTTT